MIHMCIKEYFKNVTETKNTNKKTVQNQWKQYNSKESTHFFSRESYILIQQNVGSKKKEELVNTYTIIRDH